MIAACPSSLTIARWEAGHIAESDQGQRVHAHVRACVRCAQLIDDIAGARSELFSDDPAADAARAAHTLLAIANQRRAARPRRLWRFWQTAGLPILVGAVGGLLLAPKLATLMAATLMAAPSPATLANAVSGPSLPGVHDLAALSPFGERTKGQLVISAFCKRDQAVFPARDGASFLRGDRLRFAYSAPAAGHLMLFGVDDRGQIFPYYGEGSLSSVPVAAGSKVMLPGAVELDDHHGWERIFALWAPAPVDARAVKQAVTDALAAEPDIARVGKLAVSSVDQVSFLLRRP